jgi:uncharacterized protein HemX
MYFLVNNMGVKHMKQTSINKLVFALIAVGYILGITTIYFVQKNQQTAVDKVEVVSEIKNNQKNSIKYYDVLTDKDRFTSCRKHQSFQRCKRL